MTLDYTTHTNTDADPDRKILHPKQKDLVYRYRNRLQNRNYSESKTYLIIPELILKPSKEPQPLRYQ